VSIPAIITPTPPPVAPAPPPAPLPPPGAPVAIAFPAGSAVLPPVALATLKALAAQRGSRSIAVIGFGGAHAADPPVQAAALPLALNRARAVAANLISLGVPGSAIRLLALAQGNGATARVVN
jgi:outer membrane protein OmpA-like peptidoglycan-associated protein